MGAEERLESTVRSGDTQAGFPHRMGDASPGHWRVDGVGAGQKFAVGRDLWFGDLDDDRRVRMPTLE